MTENIDMIVNEESEFADPITNALVDNIMAQLPTKKAKVTLTCDLCNLEFSSQIPLDMHLKGAKHAKRMKSKEILDTLKDDALSFDGQISSNGTYFRCEVCSIVVNSSQQLQTHLAGNKHKQKAQKAHVQNNDAPCSAKLQKLDESGSKSPTSNLNGSTQETYSGIQELPQGMNKVAKFFCDTCQICLNSNIQLQQHIASKKHLDKVMNEKEKPARKRFFAMRGKKKTQKVTHEDINTVPFRGPHLQDSFVVGEPMI